MLDPKIMQLKYREQRILGYKKSRVNAVLVPLVYSESELCLIFEKRALHLKTQPGEICFPGGKSEKEDLNFQETAIRECCEELGITADIIEIIADLDVHVSPFGFMVIPILAFISDITAINPNYDEVDKLLVVPLAYLRQQVPMERELKFIIDQDTDFPYELIPGGRDYPFRETKLQNYFYFYENEVIWGLTARILKHFLEISK